MLQTLSGNVLDCLNVERWFFSFRETNEISTRVR
jgi:hypothetical protein